MGGKIGTAAEVVLKSCYPGGKGPNVKIECTSEGVKDGARAGALSIATSVGGSAVMKTPVA